MTEYEQRRLAQWLVDNRDKVLAVLRAAREFKHPSFPGGSKEEMRHADACVNLRAAVAALGPVPGTEEG